MLDFKTALHSLRKDLTAGDVHIPTAIGNGSPRRKKRVEAYPVPMAAVDAANKALTSVEKSKVGLSLVSKRMAKKLSQGGFVSGEIVKQISDFMGGKEVKPELTWNAWGGDAAYEWTLGIVGKNDKTEHRVTKVDIAKASPTGKKIWAWASVIEENGKRVVDHQDDAIAETELEKAFDKFMSESRVSKVMHKGKETGRVVQGMVFTKDLQKALGIDLGKVGALVKIAVDDPEAQKMVASGELRELSIGGSGYRRKEI